MRSWANNTAKLKDRIGELLGLIKARSNADRAAGRLLMADEQDELVEAVGEYMRLAENSATANRETVRLLEAVIKKLSQ